MNESQLLALVANEIDNLEVSPINEKLVSLVNHKLSVEEYKKLQELAGTNSKVKILLQAYTPISNEKMASIEEMVLQQCFIKSNDTVIDPNLSKDNQSTSDSIKKINDSLKKYQLIFMALIKKYQQSIGLTLTSASLASLLVLFFGSALLDTQNLPQYSLAINGANQSFRSLNHSAKEMTQHAFSQLLKSNEVLEFYPGNKPSLLLRPTHQYPGEIEHKIYLSIQGELIPINGQAEKSDQGAVKIQLHDLLSQAFIVFPKEYLTNKDITKEISFKNKYEAVLIAIIAKKNNLPEKEDVRQLLQTASSYQAQESWQYFASPILLNRD